MVGAVSYITEIIETGMCYKSRFTPVGMLNLYQNTFVLQGEKKGMGSNQVSEVSKLAPE